MVSASAARSNVSAITESATDKDQKFNESGYITIFNGFFRNLKVRDSLPIYPNLHPLIYDVSCQLGLMIAPSGEFLLFVLPAFATP